MPRLSRWAVRASLAYLVLGFTLGAILLAHKTAPVHVAIWRLVPIHVEFLLMGWMMQLVLGVAFWSLPRFREPPVRGKESTAWLAFGLLNLGLLFVAARAIPGAPEALRVVGRGLELAAAVSFGVHAWPRVKPVALPSDL